MANTKMNQVTTVSSQSSSKVPVVGNYNYDEKVLLLTKDEKEKCLELTQKIDIHDLSSVRQYGVELSNTISHNGEQLMNIVSVSNTSEVIELTNDLFAQLKLVDVDELNDSKTKQILRRIPILRRLVTSIGDVFEKYDTIAARVDKIQGKYVQAKLVAQRDNNTLEQIFNNDVEYIQELRELIVAAKYKRQQLAAEIEKMQADPSVEAYELNDANIFLNSMDKRITDMITEEVVLEQDLFKIRMTQHNNIAIADNADNIVMHVIPMWKSQIAQSVIMNNQKASAEAGTLMYDYTQQMLKKSAEIMKTNTIEIARNAEKPMVSVDTMNEVAQSVVNTLTELRKIREEGERNRAAHEQACLKFAEQINEAIQANK